MIAFLLDEMYPSDACEVLRDEYGLDALHVREVGLGATPDGEIAAEARAHGWVLVTENVVDFAGERELVVVFVLKRNLPAGGGQGRALADLLRRWAEATPDPYRGHHWPS